MAKLLISLPNDEKRTYDLDEDKVTIGRVADNNLQIDNASVSSHHAEIQIRNGVYFLIDLGSTNGTYLNHEPITETPLNEGDSIRFGEIEAIFISQDQLAPEDEEVFTLASEISAGQTSGRPIDFHNSSPLSKQVETKDMVRTAAYALAILTTLVFVFSLYATFMMLEIPVFSKP